MRIPDEYMCKLCGYSFLEGEVPELFCPNCGSSQVIRELSYDEFFDDEDAFITMLKYDEYKNKGA